jgi:hypothetical protein
MGADEVATLDALTARREILDGLIATHGGRYGRTRWARSPNPLPSSVVVIL